MSTSMYGPSGPAYIRRRVLANAKNGSELMTSSPFQAKRRRKETMPNAAHANQRAERGKPVPFGIICGAAWKWSCRMRHDHLYLILDVYSRKIVGFEVHATDSSDHAVDLLRRTALAE